MKSRGEDTKTCQIGPSEDQYGGYSSIILILNKGEVADNGGRGCEIQRQLVDLCCQLVS